MAVAGKEGKADFLRAPVTSGNRRRHAAPSGSTIRQPWSLQYDPLVGAIAGSLKRTVSMSAPHHEIILDPSKWHRIYRLAVPALMHYRASLE